MSLRPQQVDQFLAQNPDAILVDVAVAKGSTPREAGAFMLVSGAEILGTIGGGQLEYIAIDTARAMLRNGVNEKNLNVPLGPEIGQCCGGRVGLTFARVDQDRAAHLQTIIGQDMAAAPHIYVFGAGHVGRALAGALAPLPYQTMIIDTRAEALLGLPDAITTQLTVLPEAIVRQAKPQSAFVVLTHDHALDFMIMGEVLKREDACYAGMIGSKTKRVQFARWFGSSGAQAQQLETLICPMGIAGLGDKRPEIIAALIVAEIIGNFGSKACAAPLKNANLAGKMGTMHGE